MLDMKLYFEEVGMLLTSDELLAELDAARALFIDIKAASGKLIMAGNGAGAAIAAHAATDFSKQAGLPALALTDASLVTALANDKGYENWVTAALEYYSSSGDAFVCVSVSGESPNLVNAARFARQKGMPVVSFTGKNADNSLRQLSDIGFFIDSKGYNIVEGIAMIWLTSIVDMIVGKSVYSVS